MARITDNLAATTVTTQVSEETFVSIAGPTYGTVYRGVAYVCATPVGPNDLCHSELGFGGP